MREFDLMLKDYRLTTAEIFYHLPDHPNVLQSYVWQEYDHAPDYPELHKFLDYWSHNIEGTLHSIYVASAKPLRPGAWRYAQVSLSVH
ncbi:MAG: Usg family protein [Alphaproteobacteria bacterium]|nr:Usg family protein [Alphaproteobacteria bacterium]